MILLILVTSMSGLVIYAFYAACDPIGSKMIDAPDQVKSDYVIVLKIDHAVKLKFEKLS